jgi:hypothetical protein
MLTSKILDMGREMKRKGEKTRKRYHNGAVNTAVLRIRIHLIRIRIKPQGFDDHKLQKNLQLEKKISIKNYNLPIPRPP